MLTLTLSPRPPWPIGTRRGCLGVEADAEADAEAEAEAEVEAGAGGLSRGRVPAAAPRDCRQGRAVLSRTLNCSACLPQPFGTAGEDVPLRRGLQLKRRLKPRLKLKLR